jgi:hypothetical protein
LLARDGQDSPLLPELATPLGHFFIPTLGREIIQFYAGYG